MPLSDTPKSTLVPTAAFFLKPEDINCEIISLTFTAPVSLSLPASSSRVVTFPPPSLFLFLSSTLFDPFAAPSLRAAR